MKILLKSSIKIHYYSNVRCTRREGVTIALLTHGGPCDHKIPESSSIPTSLQGDNFIKL